MLSTTYITVLILTQHLTQSQTTSDLPGHLKPFGEQGQKFNVEEHEGFVPPKKFLSEFVKPKKPVLMKNAAKESPAFELWTDEYFAKNCEGSPEGDIFVEVGKKENRSQTSRYHHFKKFLEIYNTTEIYMVDDVPNFMSKDLVMPYSLQCKKLQKFSLDMHVIWFSSGGTSSVVHHDPSENLNCLYRGSKTLVFINTTKYMDIEPKIMDKLSYSSLDVDKVDLVERPYLSGIEYGDVKMEAGDCLYIPHMWIHQVRSFGNNLAVNIWWDRKIAKNETCKREFDKKMTFKHAQFGSITKRNDKEVKGLYNSLIKEKVTSPDDLMLLMTEEVDMTEEVKGKISAVLKDIFVLMDSDSNGKIENEDVKDKIPVKTANKLDELFDTYNKLVFKIRAEKKDSEALPLYIYRTKPDIFTEDNSMGIPEGDEEKPDESKVKDEL